MPSCAARYSSRALRVGECAVELDVEVDDEPAVAGAGQQVRDGGVEGDLVEVRGIDVDDQRAQAANAPSYGLGRRLDELCVCRRAVSLLSPCSRRECVRDAGEILHRTVVQIARDLAALDLARLERAVEEQLSLLEPCSQAAGEGPCEQDLHEFEHQQRAQRDRSEAAPQPAADVFDE